MSYRAHYVFYKPVSKKGAQIGFVIDQMPFQTRRSSVMNQWEYHTERKLVADELEEMEKNREYNTRRFIVWYYADIEHLIIEDLKYDVITPSEFVAECKRRGYTEQLNLFTKHE